MPETDFPKPIHNAEIAAIATLGIAAGAGLAIYGITRFWRARHAHRLQKEQAELAARIQRGAASESEFVRIPHLVGDNPDSWRLRSDIIDFLDDMVAKPSASYTLEHIEIWNQLKEWQADREGALMEKPITDNLGVVRYRLTGFEVPTNAILPIRGLVQVRPGGIYGHDGVVHHTYGLVPMSLQTILQTEESQQVSDKKLYALIGRVAFVEVEMDMRVVDPESTKPPKDPWYGRLKRQRKYPIPVAQPRYIHMRKRYGNFIETDSPS